MSALLKKTKENGRDRLIASALKLFSEKSFHGVSVREICEHAHANASLISFHFGGKDSLLETIFQEELMDSKFEKMKNILSNPESEIDFVLKVRIFLDSFVDYYLTHQEVCSLYFEEVERGHELAEKLLPETFGGLWDQMIYFFTVAQKKEIVDASLDVRILCYQIMSPFYFIIHTRSLNYRSDSKTLEDETFRKTLINQVVRSLRGCK